MISWLAQEGPHAKKHHGWAHPIAVLIIHYTLLISFSILVQDLFVPSTPMQHITPRKTTCQSWRQSVGSFLAVYSFWLLLWRLLFCAPTIPRPSIIYEYTWLCNGTLVLGSLACFTDRPVLAMACCVTVGIDQLLWYVDLLGYFIRYASTILCNDNVFRFIDKNSQTSQAVNSWSVWPSISPGLRRAGPLVLPAHIIYGPFLSWWRPVVVLFLCRLWACPFSSWPLMFVYPGSWFPFTSLFHRPIATTTQKEFTQNSNKTRNPLSNNGVSTWMSTFPTSYGKISRLNCCKSITTILRYCCTLFDCCGGGKVSTLLSMEYWWYWEKFSLMGINMFVIPSTYKVFFDPI